VSVPVVSVSGEQALRNVFPDWNVAGRPQLNTDTDHWH
jgi:hypothetical protein